MAVVVVKGNLLEAAEDIIGHQVNCQSVMGSGVAKALKAKYPAIYPAYMNFCNGREPESLLGELQLVPAGGKRVANLFGQLKFGRSKVVYTNYDALGKALRELKDYAQQEEMSVALPYQIGCGLANGDWKVVEAMLQEIFADYKVTLYKI